MVLLREHSPDNLILGSGRARDLGGLLCICLGLLYVGGWFVYGWDELTYGTASRSDVAMIVAAASLPGLLLAAVGIYLTYWQTRWVFDRSTGTVALLRPLRPARLWDLGEVEKIELLRFLHPFGLRECYLVLSDGSRELVLRDKRIGVKRNGLRIAEFLQVPFAVRVARD